MKWKRYTPYAVAYELTLRCNMRCIHCGSAAGQPRPQEIPTQTWNQTTRELADLGTKKISLLGGEPLLHPDWYTIAATMNDHGIMPSIVTNAWIITPDIVSQLRELEFRTVAISIDGGTPTTHDSIRQCPGSFAKCLETIPLLTDAGINVSIVTTINTKNFPELPLLRDRLLNTGVAWQLQLATRIGRCPHDLVLPKEDFYAAALFIADTRKRYSIKELPIVGAHCFGYNSGILPNINILPTWIGCQAGISNLGIQSDGSIKGCLSLSPAFIEGNITTTSLTSLWTNPASFAYNRRYTPDNLTESCTDCRFGAACKGGCLCVSASETGKPHADPYCLYALETTYSLQARKT
jgi:radical SAM protein with 4Fe4S-binding SPASM domain